MGVLRRWVGLTLFMGVTMMASQSVALGGSVNDGASLLHTDESFAFVAHAPLEAVWPLFGAHQERVWAPGWDPEFLWPEKPADQHGAVFRVAHGSKTAIWLTTAFDQAAKDRVQYVYVIPDVVATIITLRLTPKGSSTAVSVRYERTALSALASEIVQKMASNDKVAGPDWERQINDYLSQQP